ncbi:hypothetical protein BJV82DRAFT_606144 [Fennellomyces sp. T-0311]|nr:hypothetical protein BJV82DRAFT_606144 [Fennellomyces sp. T-0311]
MATPSTNEVLFVVIIVILFFILLGICLFCIYRATTPTKRQREAEQQQHSLQAQQIQYITASQLESLRPPELARQLYGEKQLIHNDNKRRSILNKFFTPRDTNNGMIRPSSVREPSFRPMQQPPTIVVDDAVALRDAEVAALAQTLPPPAYGDHRTSTPLRFDQPSFTEKN